MASKQVLALSVETEKSIFFYTGTFFGLLGLIVKLLSELYKFVY
jgi:hypothetical protein